MLKSRPRASHKGARMKIVLDTNANKVPDPKDLPFAEAAVSGGAQTLVTGNEKHFSFLEEFGVKVLNPQIFLKKAA